jgi:hypothetical protein
MKSLLNRRQFLTTTGAAASAALVGKSLLRPLGVQAATFTRMDVGNLTASSSQIVSYAKAVKAMQMLPASDPRSWSYQAAIHGTIAPCPCGVSWNTCEHGTEFFWSWHRMYLYYFEKIIRRYSGDYGWALPYWNWQLASENKLPPMFRDTSSALYTPNRDPGINAGTSTLASWVTDCSTALGDLAFTDAVEDIQTPHGNVHVTVGGWMASVPTSAQDPIFYLHHSNVDRLWNIWLAQGGGRSDPIADATWKGKTYTFFDENAKQVTMTDCDVVRAAQQLNYGYQGEPTQVNEYCTVKFIIPPWLLQLKLILQLPIPPVEVNSDKVSVPVELGENAQHVSAVANSANQKLFVVLDNIEADNQPDLLYQVYVGLPEGAAADPKSPYYVGTFSLFGMGVHSEMKDRMFMPAKVRFAVKGAVATTLRAKGKLSVTVVPVNPRAAAGKTLEVRTKSTLKIGTISFAEGANTKATQ